MHWTDDGPTLWTVVQHQAKIGSYKFIGRNNVGMFDENNFSHIKKFLDITSNIS